MANPYKVESYWTIRRRIRSNISVQLADIQNSIDIAGTSTEPVHNNVDVTNQHLVEKSCDTVEICSDMDDNLSDENQLINFERYFHPHSIASDSESDIFNIDTDDDNDCDSLAPKLRDWAVKYQIPNVSLSELLSILRPLCPSLPKDPRTLLKTKVSYDIEDIGGGQYYHFGIISGSSDVIETCVGVLPDGYCLKLQINIDGLPLFKSSNHQLWPVCGRFLNIENSEPFIIGLFSGMSKPHNLNEYLRNFVQEYNDLSENGFEFCGKHMDICIDSVVCDTPARAFVKCVKSHSGYSGCDKCSQSGVWNGKMTFPETDSELRTDISFNEMVDEDHHKGPTPFTDIKLGMVSQFPLDYMHLVCLGVMKRLLLIWIKGPLSCRLGSTRIGKISELLVSIKDCIPLEFSRKPRSLNEIDRWKATEFRQFLLYSGPVVLLQTLDPVLYKNFMMLCVAMHILLNDLLCKQFNSYAHNLMVAFVKHFCQIYGNDMAVYNVHGLVHLAKDAEKYGSLDNISSFPFENFLCKLKRLVRKPSFPLQQVIRRLSEKKHIKSSENKYYPMCKNEHHWGPLPNHLLKGVQFRSLITKNYHFKLNKKDCYMRVDGKIGMLRNIVSFDCEIFVIYQAFSKIDNFFVDPLPSSYLGIFIVSDLENNIQVTKVGSIQAKCVLLPYKQKLVAIPYADTVWSKFAVVEFSDDQEVEIVSGAWLTENKSKCYWPNYKSLAKVQLAIKNGKEPDSEFTCLDIRVLYETDDYLKARQNLRKAQYTSDLQTEAEEEEKDNERKRTKRPNPRYQSLSSSDSEDDCKESSKVSKSSKPLPEYPVLPALPLPKSPQPLVKQHISSPSPSPSLSPTPSTSKQFPTLFGSPKQINSSAVEVKFLTALEEIKAQVKHNTHMLQAVLKWIDSKDNVEEQYVAINYEFPIATMETLLEIDDKLDSTEFYKSLLHNLGMIGGDTVPSSVRRILKYIMTDEVAKKINWSGKGGKQAFSSMRLSGLLPKAVRKNRLCTSATDNEIAKTAKDWFRFASDRNGGRRNRMNKTIQNNSI